MALREQLQSDLKDAMKGGEDTRKIVIRSVMAAIKETEQRKREDLVKKALKKHNVVKPVDSEETSLSAYQQAIDRALAAENVEADAALSEAETVAVVQRLVKQRQESIDQADQAGRADIASAERREMEILSGYLPQQMPREDLEAEARTAISEVGATDVKDMGKVMSALMPRVQGRADGKMVSDVVRSLLQK